MRISGIIPPVALAIVLITLCSCAAQQNPPSPVPNSQQAPTAQADPGEFLISQGQSVTVRCVFEGDAVKIQSIEKGEHKGPGALTFAFSKGIMGTTLLLSNCTGRHLTYDAYIKVGKSYQRTSIMGAIAGVPGFESWADSFSTLKINNIRLLDLALPAKGCDGKLLTGKS